MSTALVTREPAQMTEAELVDFARSQGVTWIGFWSLGPLRFEHRRIWRRPYPRERTFLSRYFPVWFAEQDFSIRNAIITKRSRNLVGNNIVMAPSKFENQGYHGGLSPVADTATLGHELLHALDRQLGGRLDIWASYVLRQAPDPETGAIDENAYYEFDASLTRPAEMLEQFCTLNPEAQAELFEEGLRRSEALEKASDEDKDEARAGLEAYTAVLEFVRSLSRGDRLRLG